jgi:hypothetical protein
VLAQLQEVTDAYNQDVVEPTRTRLSVAIIAVALASSACASMSNKEKGAPRDRPNTDDYRVLPEKMAASYRRDRQAWQAAAHIHSRPTV